MVLIDIARCYIDLLVEIETYKRAPRREKTYDEETNEYEEIRNLRRSYRAGLIERTAFIKEAKKEIKEVEIAFMDALKEASTEEIKGLITVMKNDEYLAELDAKRENTFEADAYLAYYKELNTYLTDQVLSYRENSKRKSLK